MAKFKVGDKVRVHSPGYRANGAEGSILMVYLSGNPQKYLVDFGGGAHSEMTETSLVAANSRACNDKWIDDFHVIVTSGKPDASLLSALKEKATAWKLSKKNFSDRTAADRHNAAESKVYDIARRLGAKVIQQGAVMKVVMPNSRALNAKFKVGDKVVMRDGRKGEVVSSAPGPMGGEMYHVRLEDGRLTDSAERNIAAANSHACNSVRGNTKLKDIDYWFEDNGYGDDTLIKYVPSYKKNRCIDFVDRYADTYARDKFYDAMYKLTGIKCRWALNSRACNSTNPIVRKAMNDKVSMNSVDANDKEEMAKFFTEMNDAISEISRLDMEFASYIKGLLNKAEKTQDKDLADWLKKANLEWKNLKIKGKIMR